MSSDLKENQLYHSENYPSLILSISPSLNPASNQHQIIGYEAPDISSFKEILLYHPSQGQQLSKNELNSTSQQISQNFFSSRMSILDCQAQLLYEEKLEELLLKEELLLTQVEVQDMAVKIFMKHLRSRLETIFINKLLRSTPFFEQEDPDIINSDIFTRDVSKNFKCSFYKKHHQLFEIGSVYCLIQDEEKLKSFQDLKSHTNIDFLKKGQINKVPNHGIQRKPSVEIQNIAASQPNSEKKFTQENQLNFIEVEYPTMKIVNELHSGNSFGEIALISPDCRRTATVVFREDSYVISLDKPQFEAIMKNYKKYSLDDNLMFLKTFSFFSNVQDKFLFGMLKQMTYIKSLSRTVIYSERDSSDSIFFLKKGCIEITRLQNSFRDASSKKQSQATIKIEKQNDSKQYDKDGEAKDQMILEKKEKNKSQKRITIASLGEGSYFGEEEAQIAYSPFRLSRAVCQEGKTEIFSISKQHLFDLLKTQGQLQFFLSDALSRHEMRQERIFRLLQKESESKEWAISQKFIQENEKDQNQQTKIMKSPQNSMSARQQQGGIEPQINTSSNLNQSKSSFLLEKPKQRQKSKSNFSTGFKPPNQRNYSLAFVDEEKDQQDNQFERVWNRKRQFTDIKKESQVFNTPNDNQLIKENQIMKEENIAQRSRVSSLSSLEKFSFQQEFNTKKNKKENKRISQSQSIQESYSNIPIQLSSIQRERQENKKEESTIDDSMDLHETYNSVFINSKMQQPKAHQKIPLQKEFIRSFENKPYIHSTPYFDTPVEDHKKIDFPTIKSITQIKQQEKQGFHTIYKNNNPLSLKLNENITNFHIIPHPFLSPAAVHHPKSQQESQGIYNPVHTERQKKFEESLSKTFLTKRSQIVSSIPPQLTSPKVGRIHSNSIKQEGGNFSINQIGVLKQSKPARGQTSSIHFFQNRKLSMNSVYNFQSKHPQ